MKHSSAVLAFVAVGTLICGLSASLSAQVVYQAARTTAGHPTWARPVEGLPPIPPVSIVGAAVPFDRFGFRVSQSGLYTLQSNTQVIGGSWDNYLFLYVGAFDAAKPFQNILAGNDDADEPGLSGFDFALDTNKDYFAVTTGFFDEDFGAYQIIIKGPGEVTDAPSITTPEPSTMWLGAIGLLAIAGFRIRLLRKVSR